MSDYKTLAKFNGYYGVMDKTKEECTELIEAIETGDANKITEEVSDVLLMCFQVLEVMQNQEKVQDTIEYKIKRTIEKYNIKEEK